MITDYEYRYSIDGGVFVSPIQCTTENSVDNGDGTITINDIPDGEIDSGDFQVRTRAINGKSASAWLSSDAAFTSEASDFIFNQPTDLFVGDSGQVLSLYTDGDFNDINVVSSNELIATVSKISGIWYLVPVSEGSVNLTASMPGFSDIIRSVEISSQFEGIQFVGFTVNPTIVDGELIITEGSADFSKRIQFDFNTNDVCSEFEIEYEVGAVSGSTFGLGIGKRSINTTYNVNSMVCQYGITIPQFLIWNVDASNTYTVCLQENLDIDAEEGDILSLKYIQNGNLVTIYAENKTKTLDGEFSKACSLSIPILENAPNASQLCIWSFGVDHVVKKVMRSTSRIPKAKITFIGDSKTFGFSAVAYDDTFFSIVKDNFDGSANNFGGTGDKTAEAILTIDNSLIGVTNGQYVILCIGRNDLASGVAEATWQANYSTIVSKIKATGATIIHLKHIPETETFTAVNEYIDEEFPSDLKIDPSVGWDMGTMLSSDTVHPNATGHAFVADKIISSGYII